MNESLKARFWEVDLLRGIAVIMMIAFHFFFDLNYFGLYSVDTYSGFWFYFARITAGIFVFLVGVSLALSASRAEKQEEQEGQEERKVREVQEEQGLQKAQNQERQIFLRLLKRGLWIFSLGMVVTLVTYLFLKDGFIVFGILHFIGISIIIAYPFLKLERLKMDRLKLGGLNLIGGLLIIIAGLYLQNLSFGFSWLLWLGLTPEGFYTLDFFPLSPWFGVVLVGLFLGSYFYEGYQRRIDFPDLSASSFVRPLAFVGQNSLLIYLIHQPLLISAFYFSGLIPIPF